MTSHPPGAGLGVGKRKCRSEGVGGTGLPSNKRKSCGRGQLHKPPGRPPTGELKGRNRECGQYTAGS